MKKKINKKIDWDGLMKHFVFILFSNFKELGLNIVQ